MEATKAASALGAHLAVLNGVVSRLSETVTEGDRVLRKARDMILAEEAALRAKRALLAEAKREASNLAAALNNDGSWTPRGETLDSFLNNAETRYNSIMKRFYAATCAENASDMAAASATKAEAPEADETAQPRPDSGLTLSAEPPLSALVPGEEPRSPATDFTTGRDEPALASALSRGLERAYLPVTVLCLAAVMFGLGADLIGLHAHGFDLATACPAHVAPRVGLFPAGFPANLFRKPVAPPVPTGMPCEHRVYLHGAVGLLSIGVGCFAASLAAFPRLVGGFSLRFALTIALQVVLMGATYATRVWALGAASGFGVVGEWVQDAVEDTPFEALLESGSARDTFAFAMVGVIGSLTLTLLRASLAAGAEDVKGKAAGMGGKLAGFAAEVKGLVC